MLASQEADEGIAMVRLSIVSVILGCLLSIGLLRAQSYTHLSGLIRDPSDGSYVVVSLEPGLYKITARRVGFRTLIRLGIRLELAQPVRVDFTLTLGSVQESITVEGAPATLHTEDASIGTLIGRDQIEQLPLNGHNLLGLLELTPGTIVTPATRGEAGQFTADGQRPNTNYFSIDGVSVNTGVSAGGVPAQSTGGSLPAMTALGTLHTPISPSAVT